MLNDGWNEGMTADESKWAGDEAYRDAHPDCIECGGRGCNGEDCPAGEACDIPVLTYVHREFVHRSCAAKFEAHIANKCDGTACHCEAAPELVEADDECATERTKVEPYEPIESCAAGVFRRLAAVAALVLACVSGVACAHGGSSPAVQVEQVGALTAGPSTWSAPVHETSAPPTVEIAGSADDDDAAAPVVTAADAGPDAAPAIERKAAHGF